MNRIWPKIVHHSACAWLSLTILFAFINNKTKKFTNFGNAMFRWKLLKTNNLSSHIVHTSSQNMGKVSNFSKICLQLLKL